jgi:NADH-quinone oxidoreductase subunit N
VLACFVVVCRISTDGTNVALDDLAGLHRRSPLLALTLLVGVFGLAGIPPFAGFMGKLGLLKAAFAKGHLVLVVLAVVNSAVAIYYYLGIVREACFRDPAGQPAVSLNLTTRVLCILLIIGIIALGVAPSWFLDTLSSAVAGMNAPLDQAPAVLTAQ